MADAEFERLVEKFYMPLYRFGLSLSRNESDAADLTQQHAFHMWAAKGHQLRDSSKVKTWLFTTLYREFLSRKRQASRFVETDNDSQFVEPSQVESSVVNTLDAVIVQQALQELNERYRAPVTLFYMKEHSYREIADILEIPIGTVMSRISRGKAELRTRLADLAVTEERKVVPLRRVESNG